MGKNKKVDGVRNALTRTVLLQRDGGGLLEHVAGRGVRGEAAAAAAAAAAAPLQWRVVAVRADVGGRGGKGLFRLLGGGKFF